MLKSEQLNRLLINKFPNLKEKYLDEVSWQEGDSTGSHTVYGDVLTPYLVECIINDNLNETKNIFDFLEEILALEDKYSDEVIAFSVIESTAYLISERDFLSSYLRAKTKKAFDEVTNATLN